MLGAGKLYLSGFEPPNKPLPLECSDTGTSLSLDLNLARDGSLRSFSSRYATNAPPILLLRHLTNIIEVQLVITGTVHSVATIIYLSDIS